MQTRVAIETHLRTGGVKHHAFEGLAKQATET